jgi:acetyl esterase
MRRPDKAMPMHADFRKLVALRRFLMKGDPRNEADHGRLAAARWVARNAPAVPDGLSIETTDIGRRIAPPDHAPDPIVYIHGGGLVYYDTEVFTPFLAQIADRTGRAVYALDYPKAPETPAPRILAHLKASVRRIAGDHPRISLMGDSVGALLAAHLANEPQVADLHMIYPVTDLSTDAEDPHGIDHFLDTALMDWFYGFISPIGAAPTALPKTTVHIAENDILAPQARSFAAKAKTEVHEYPGLPHDFCLFSGTSNAAAEAVRQIASGLKASART